MNAFPRKLALASAIAIALLTAGGTVTAATSQEVIAARQESQIWTTYALSPYLRANDLTVVVVNGKATLAGIVDEDVNKDLAKEIALGVQGVKEVDNQIVVQADYVPPARSGDRSYGAFIDDATITAAVKSKLLWSKHTHAATTQVETKAGKVTLRGEADSAAAMDAAHRVALNTRGVVAVDNRLVLGKPGPTATDSVKSNAEEAGREIADTWITAKVKSTYAYSSNVDGSDIAVKTGDGIVTLSGKVASGAERALAIELARNVRGVRKVKSKGLIL